MLHWLFDRHSIVYDVGGRFNLLAAEIARLSPESRHFELSHSVAVTMWSISQWIKHALTIFRLAKCLHIPLALFVYGRVSYQSW